MSRNTTTVTPKQHRRHLRQPAEDELTAAHTAAASRSAAQVWRGGFPVVRTAAGRTRLRAAAGREPILLLDPGLLPDPLTRWEAAAKPWTFFDRTSMYGLL